MPQKPDQKLILRFRKFLYLVFLGLPAATVLSVCGADFFSNTTELNWVGRIGWMVSLGWPISFLAF